MDPLKSGAIFHIKNIAAIRSPAANAPVSNVPASTASISDRNASHTSPSLEDEQAKIIKQRFDQIYRATPVPTAILGGHMAAPLGAQSMHLHHSPRHVASTLVAQSMHLHPSPPVAPLSYQMSPYMAMGPPIGSPRHIHNNTNDYHYTNTNDDEYLPHSPQQTVATNETNDDNKTNNNNENITKKRSQLLKNDSLLNLGKGSTIQPAATVTTTTAATAVASTNSTSNIANKSQRQHISPPPAKLIAAVPKKRGRKKKNASIIFNPGVDKASPRGGKRSRVFEPVYIIEDVGGSSDNKYNESVGSDQELLNENSNDSYDRKTTRSGRTSVPVTRLIDLPRAKVSNKEEVDSNEVVEDEELEVNRNMQQQEYSDDDDYVDGSDITGKKKRGRKKNPVNNAKKVKSSKEQPMIVQHVPDNYQSPPKKWDPREMTALYRAHAATDASDPQFWETVSSNITAQGIPKDPDECRQLWFQSLQEAQRRKNNKIKPPTATETVAVKKKGKAELKRLAEEVAKADKEDDLFDYRRQLDDGAASLNTFVDEGIIEQFDDVISPIGPQHARNTESPVEDVTTMNDWKASYVHNLSKRVASIATTKAGPAATNKLGSTVKPKKQTNKKVMEGGISGVLDFKKGKINVVLANNNSDDDDEEIVDTEDDE